MAIMPINSLFNSAVAPDDNQFYPGGKITLPGGKVVPFEQWRDVYNSGGDFWNSLLNNDEKLAYTKMVKPDSWQQVSNTGGFEYTPGRDDSDLTNFAPLMTIAGIAAGAGALSGAASGFDPSSWFGSGVGESVSGNFAPQAGELAKYAASYGGTAAQGGSSLMDMIRATQSSTPYLRTGDIPNAMETVADKPWGVNPGGTTMASDASIDYFKSLFGDGAATDLLPPPTYTPGAVTASMLPGGGMMSGGIAATGNAGLDAYLSGGLSTGGADSSWMEKVIRSVGETAGKSLIERVLNGNPTAADVSKLLGTLGSTGLAALGSSQQSGALADLAKKYSEYGAPSRSRFEASMTPGFDPTSIPGYSGALDTASKSILAKLSATGGNPFGNPGGLIEANKAIVSGTAMPAINEYQRLNLAGGGLANLNAAVPGIDTGSITANRGVTTALSSGLGSLTEDNSLEGLLAKIQKLAGGYKFDPVTGASLS